MNLIKVKGVVIKEITYKDNDKIITILTDSVGKISCMAKGSKKTNSPILASSQYLVYSEFVISKGTSYYYINSSDVINTFYNLRIDLDKLDIVFELTKLIQKTTDENQDTSSVLKLFLNTLYVIDKFNKDSKLVIAIFKLKLLSILGFSPRIEKCEICSNKFILDNREDNIKEQNIYYDYVSNIFLCQNCIEKDKRRYVELNLATVLAIKYVVYSDTKKVFSFDLRDKSLRQFITFSQVYVDSITNGI